MAKHSFSSRDTALLEQRLKPLTYLHKRKHCTHDEFLAERRSRAKEVCGDFPAIYTQIAEWHGIDDAPKLTDSEIQEFQAIVDKALLLCPPYDQRELSPIELPYVDGALSSVAVYLVDFILEKLERLSPTSSDDQAWVLISHGWDVEFGDMSTATEHLVEYFLGRNDVHPSERKQVLALLSALHSMANQGAIWAPLCDDASDLIEKLLKDAVYDSVKPHLTKYIAAVGAIFAGTGIGQALKELLLGNKTE